MQNSARRSIFFFVLLALLGSVKLLAQGATLYVGPGQPYATIQSAINAAGNYDTVSVAPGTYYEHIDFLGKAVTVMSGTGAAATVIDGSGAGPVVTITGPTNGTPTLRDFTIRNGGKAQTSGGPQGGVYVSNASPSIRSNTISAAYCEGVASYNANPILLSNHITGTLTTGCAAEEGVGSGVKIAGNATNAYAMLILQSNLIDYNTASVAYKTDTGGGGAINVTGTTSILIAGNTLRYNVSTGYGGAVYVATTPSIQFIDNLVYGNKGVSGGLDIVIPGSSVGPLAGAISNNTIAYNTATTANAGSDIYIGGNLAQYALINNIVVGFTSGQTAVNCGVTYASQTLTPLIFDHNDIYSVPGSNNTPVGGACATPAPQLGNISADPLFVNGTGAAVSAGTADFHLKSGSPAIDAGNNSVPVSSIVDIENNLRVVDATSRTYPVIDMGPYEFSGTQDGPVITVLLTPATYTPAAGGSDVLSARVTSSLGAGPASGIVTFSEDFTNVGAAVINSSGVATLTLSNITAGLHNLVATYAPSGGSPLQSSSIDVIINAVASASSVTMTTLGSSLNPSNFGQTVTFTAHVTSVGGSVPTGTVYFYDGSTPLGSQAVDGSGNAPLATSTLAAGTRSITASFVPTGGFTGSSASYTQTVIAPPAAQTISFPTPAPAYQSTASVLTATASSGLPVTYTLVSGPAVLHGALLNYTGVGTVVVQADQAGNASYLAAPSVQIAITVSLLSVPVGSSSSVLTAGVTFTAAGTVSGINVLTQGSAALDFGATVGSSGGVPTCSPGVTYAVGQSCIVGFVFKPTAPGQRLGAITLPNSAGAVLGNTYVSGYGTGPQLTFLPGTESVLNTAVGRIVFVVANGAGDLFGLSQYTGLLQLTAASGYTTATLLNGTFLTPAGIAIDGAGNLFVVDSNTATVTELFAAKGYTTSQTIGSGWSYPSAVAVDANGNVFVADRNLHAIKEFTYASGYGQSTALSGSLGQVIGLALDSNANLFTLDINDSIVRERSAASGYQTETKVAGPFTFSTNLGIDANDNLYVSNGTNTVQELLAIGSYTATRTLTTTGMFSGLAFDSKGNLYGADFRANSLGRLDVSDPPTLTFASTPVGQTSKDSPKTITLFNNGNVPLAFAPSANGVNPNITDGFLLGAGTTCPQVLPNGLLVPLNPGASCVDSISFKPATAGSISGSLTLTDNNLNAAGSTQVIPLNAMGTLIPTSAVMTVSPSNPTYGMPLTLTATVTAASAPQAIITGSVAFYEDTFLVGTAPLNPNTRLAVLSVSTVTAGPHTFNCVYSGDAAFASSSCAYVPVTVTVAATSLTLSASRNPSPALTPITFTASLITTPGATPVAGVPVVFSVDGKVAATMTTNASGAALYVSPGFTPGAHTVIASFAGDSAHTGASPATVTEFVVPNPTTTTLIGAPNPGTQNQPVTLVANVAASTGASAPTGNVQFLDNGNILAVYPVQSPAQGTVSSATLTTSSLTPGVHILNAIYLPADGSFTTSSAPPLSLTILPQSLTLTTSQPSITIQTEHHGSVGVTLTSVGGLSGRFTLACGALPDAASCTWVSNNLYLPANGTVSTTLKLDTDVILGFKSSVEMPARPGGLSGDWAGRVSLALLLPLGLAFVRRRSRARLLPMLLVATIFSGLAGCGDKYPAHTPPGTYTIPITASGVPDGGSTTLQQSVKLTLIVTP